MSLRASWLAWACASLVVGGVSCSKTSPSDDNLVPPGRNGDPADKLWDLAPDGIELGMVVTPHALEVADHAITAVRALSKQPDFAMAGPPLEEMLGQMFGKGNATPADGGLALDKGFALFIGSKGEELVLLPVGDRQKFVSAHHGKSDGDVDHVAGETCKQLPSGYWCTTRAEAFDRIGKGSMSGKPKAAGARGDIEIVVDMHSFGKKRRSGHNRDKDDDSDPPLWGYITVSVDDGMLDARGVIPMPGEAAVASIMFKDARGPKPDTSGTAGFLTFDLGPVTQFAPPDPLLPGLTIADIARAVKGTFVATISSGGMAGKAEVALTDKGDDVFEKLLAKCEMISGLAPGLTAKAGDKACSLAYAGPPKVETKIAIDGKALVATVDTGDTSKGPDVLDSVGKDLASGDWAFAVWGRGSMLSNTGVPMSAYMSNMPMGPEVKGVLRVMSMMSEVGFGAKITDDGVAFRATFRTIFANPKDVVDKLLAITGEDMLNDKARATAKDIAASSPSSPFATDLQAGQGLMLPTSGIGVLAAVAIPAFMDYTKKSKKTEAEIQLNKLMKNSKTVFITTDAYIVGDQPLTPAKPCCSQGGKCQPSAADWSTPTWQALDFQIDEPFLCQYGYKSDGKTADIQAVCDLDCDGQPATYTMHMDSAGGNPSSSLQKPPPGEY